MLSVVFISLSACGSGDEVSDSDKTVPLHVSIFATPEVVARGESVSLRVITTGLDGVALRYGWSSPDGWELDATDKPTVVATAPDQPDVNATFMVTVTDAGGREASAQLQVSTAPNQSPRIRSATALPSEVLPGAAIELRVDAVDPDGDDLSYEWLAPGGWGLSDKTGGTTTLNVPDAYNSSARIGVVVSDAHGATDQTELVVSTIRNQGPAISSLIVSRPIADPGEQSYLEAIASHQVEDALEYAWEADGGFSVLTEGFPVTSPALRAPNEEGAVGTVRVTVTDSTGATAQSALVVQTRNYLAPVIQSITAISPVEFGDSAFLSVSAVDPEGGTLSYSWSTDSGSVAILSPSSKTTKILGGNPDELVTFTLQVSNSVGKTSVAEAVVLFPGL